MANERIYYLEDSSSARPIHSRFLVADTSRLSGIDPVHPQGDRVDAPWPAGLEYIKLPRSWRV